MLKELRIKARGFLKLNYKALMPPAFLLMALNAVTVAIVEYSGYENVWSRLNTVTKSGLLLVYFVIKLAVVPLISVVFFKIIVLLQQQKGNNIKAEIKNFLTAQNIKKILLLNLIPTSVGLLAYSSGIHFLNIFSFRLYAAEFSAVYKFIYLLIEYKFLFCNYYFSLNQSGVKETISISFKVMKWKKIFRLIYISLVFLPWAILDGIIYLALNILASAVIDGYMTETVYTGFGRYTVPVLSFRRPLDVLNCFWLGLGFYVFPYAYVISTLFLEQLFKDFKKYSKITQNPDF